MICPWPIDLHSKEEYTMNIMFPSLCLEMRYMEAF